MSHIVPLWSPASDALSIGLLINKVTAYPVAYPTVPKNTKRVRLVFHVGNTEEDVEVLVKVIGEWLDERFKGETIAGVEAGFADTWADFGKIQEMKKDETKMEGVVNGHSNGLTNGHFEDKDMAQSGMHGIMSGATIGATVGATIEADHGDKNGVTVFTSDLEVIDEEKAAMTAMAHAIPVEINLGVQAA